MLVIILVIIVAVIVFLLINKNNKNNTNSNMFLDNTVNEDNIVKEKEKSNTDINVKNIDMAQNDFNPFIYDRLYNPYSYPNYPYYNYTYDIRPFPRQYPGRIYDYHEHNRNFNIQHKPEHYKFKHYGIKKLNK